ncbi:hypothetical protein EMIT0P74_80132 [Pseudomonas sp. IT-P74]
MITLGISASRDECFARGGTIARGGCTRLYLHPSTHLTRANVKCIYLASIVKTIRWTHRASDI